MKEIPLTRGKVAIVDDEDYEWLNQWKWTYASAGYAYRMVGRKAIYMHRLIMGEPEGMDVDHKDVNGLHNWRDNLRVCTRAENLLNKKKRSDAKVPYKGLHYHEGRRKPWQVRVRMNGKTYYGGYYEDAEDARQAREELAKKLHGEFFR